VKTEGENTREIYAFVHILSLLSYHCRELY